MFAYIITGQWMENHWQIGGGSQMRITRKMMEWLSG